MSLPPALLARLAQRGLVNKQKAQKENEPPVPVNPAENEEVIAEDYDEMDSDQQNQQNSEEYQYPSQYDLDHDLVRKPMEDNNWLQQMKARMGEASSAAGYKCCPNKYNVWHKCTLYCVNRWAEGIPKPSAEYMKRYKRLIRKYPLPKGWVEMYDPGCGCYYFASEAENLVSWLPPTHPKSEVTKCAAAIRKQMEESTGEQNTEEEAMSDAEDEPIKESAQARHHREVEEIINASLRPKSPRTLDSHEFPSLQEAAGSPTVSLPRKQKSRDLDRALSRQRKDRDRNERSERDRERYSNHGGGGGSGRRHHNRNDDVLDPMDPSAYSDTPRGKWSDGLATGEGERKKKSEDKKEKNERESRRSDHSDEED